MVAFQSRRKVAARVTISDPGDALLDDNPCHELSIDFNCLEKEASFHEMPSARMVFAGFLVCVFLDARNFSLAAERWK